MRTLGLGMCVIAMLAISALLDRESGISRWLELREDLAVSTERVVRLARDNDAMRREISLLEAEPAAIDRAIREELDVALPGEVVVRFTRTAGIEVEAAASGDEAFSLRRLLGRGQQDRETR